MVRKPIDRFGQTVNLFVNPLDMAGHMLLIGDSDVKNYSIRLVAMGMRIEPCDVAFIGGGVAASAGIRGLLHENTASGNPLDGIEIVIIEPRSRLGVGTAWDTANRTSLTNMATPTLSLYGGLDGELAGFDIRHSADLMDGGPACDPGVYLSRSLVGDRLADHHREIEPVAARSNIRIEHVRAEATRICRSARGFRIEVAGRTVEARSVVLALGLLSVNRYPSLCDAPGYHADPWAPGDFLAGIGDKQRVAIIGMGPTAIDWALQLGERGLHHPVLMASRSGRLPAVRPRSLLTDAPGLVDATLLGDYGSKSPFTPDMVDLIVYGILDRYGVTGDELRAYCAFSRGTPREMLERTLGASDTTQPLFEALKALDRLAPALWRWSGEAAKDRIMRKWARIHARLSYAIPPSNGAALLDLIDSGDLITRARLQTARRTSQGFALAFTDSPSLVEADVLINATGFDGPLSDTNNRLVRALLADGLLTEAPYGGARVEYATGRVLDRDGHRIEGLFVAGGSLTRSAAYVVNSLLRTSEHAIKVGVACARHLRARLAEPSEALAQWNFII